MSCEVLEAENQEPALVHLFSGASIFGSLSSGKDEVSHIDNSIQVVFKSRRAHIIFSSRILTEEGGRKANIVCNTALFFWRGEKDVK
jgi:hypothetical protein